MAVDDASEQKFYMKRKFCYESSEHKFFVKNDKYLYI